MNYTEVIGIVAGVLTSISFIPQIVKIRKTKSTKDLSWGMFGVFSLGIVLWLIYGLIINQFPVILANIVTLTFSGIIIYYKFKYKD